MKQCALINVVSALAALALPAASASVSASAAADPFSPTKLLPKNRRNISPLELRALGDSQPFLNAEHDCQAVDAPAPPPGSVPLAALPPELRMQFPPTNPPPTPELAEECLRNVSHADHTGIFPCGGHLYAIELLNWHSVDDCVDACFPCIHDNLLKGKSIIGCHTKSTLALCWVGYDGGESITHPFS